MHRMILLSADGPDGPMAHPILKRDDVQMKCFAYLEHAYKAAQNIGRGLIICEQVAGKDVMMKFLRALEVLSGPSRSIAVICVWKGDPPEDLPPIVIASLPHPPPEEEYGRAIADYLKPPRSKDGKRYLVRVWLTGQEKPVMILCTAIEANLELMLLESTKKLALGKVYEVQLMGLNTPVPILQARIKSEEPQRPGSSLRYYTALFEEMLPSKTEALARGLKIALPSDKPAQT